MEREVLSVVVGQAAGREIPLGEPLEIGRKVEGPGLLTGDPEVSRRHARIEKRPDGTLVLEDLGSANGTLVNGSRIPGPVALEPGDMIEVGDTTLRVDLRAAPAPAEPAPAEPAPAEPATREAPSAGPSEPTPPAAAGPPEPDAARPLRPYAPRGQGSLVHAGLPTSMRGRIFPSIGLLLVQLMVAWEWLISGLTKVFRGGFPSGLADDLTEQSKEAAGWYRSFLDAVVIPNGSLFGYLIMITELVVGIVLLATALVWLLRWESLRRRQRDVVLLLTAAACAVAISLNVGLYLASGDPLPFFIGDDPFDEGIGLDVVLPWIELILGGVALWTYLSLRRSRRPSGPGAGHAARVVIAGGGFGGIAAARLLENRMSSDGARITLVSDSNFQLYTPLLPGAAGGGLEPSSVAIPLREQLKRTELRVGRIVGADPDRGVLVVQPLRLPDQPGPARPSGAVEEIPYDHLIVALGSVSRALPIPGLSQHAVGLKTLPEAIALHNHVLNTLELAEETEDPEERAALLTYVFVGGGYAGVEGIAELHDFAAGVIKLYPSCRRQGMRWVLVDRSARLLPELSTGLGEFVATQLWRRGIEILGGAGLEEVTRESVRLSSGDVIPTHTVAWTAGVEPHPVVGRLGLPTDERGGLRVDAHLRVEGAEGIWAVGDAASVTDPDHGDSRLCPPTAQHATRQGKVAGRNVAAALGTGSAAPFSYRARGVVVDLGRRKAVAETFGLRWRGLLAWLIARGAHTQAMPGARRRLRLVVDWASDALSGRDASQLGQLGEPPSLDLEGHSSGGVSAVAPLPSGVHTAAREPTPP